MKKCKTVFSRLLATLMLSVCKSTFTKVFYLSIYFIAYF